MLAPIHESGIPRDIFIIVWTLLSICGTHVSAQGPDADRADQSVIRDLGDEVSAEEQKILDLVAQLASSKFAVREEASVEILKIGRPAVPMVIEAAKSDDIEVRMRSRELLRRLTENDFESQVEAFLAGSGDDAAMPGWASVKGMLGNSAGARELFVEAARTHQKLIASLDEGANSVSPLVEKSAESIRERVFVKFKAPDRGDLTALLLACGDPLAKISAAVEKVIGRLANGPIVAETLRDKRLAPIFQRMLGFWIRRAEHGSQSQSLMIGLQYGIADALDLGLRNVVALSNSQDLKESDFLEGKALDTLELSFLAIARFGNIDHVYAVRPLLDDSRRMMVSPMYFEGQPLQVEVRDMASAVLVRLTGGDLEAAGFPAVREHPKVAFFSGSLGFPPNDKESRAHVREYVNEMLRKDQ